MRVERGPPLEVPEINLAQLFFERVAEAADAPGFLVKKDGRFEPWSWGEVGARVREIANGLLALGLGRGEKVAILSSTRPEWVLADFGILAAGGVTVTVYPTLTGEQVLYLLNDSGAKLVFVEDAEQYEKLRPHASKAASVQAWITLDDVPHGADEMGKRTLRLDEVAETGRAHAARRPQDLDQRVASVSPDDVSTIIYTSGTTGVPKGAVLTHRNWVAASRSLIATYDLRSYPERRIVVFLPLAHVMSRLITVVFMDTVGTMAFGSPRSLGEDFRAVQPTTTVSVPRVYERMYDQIHKALQDAPAARRRIFARAEAVAKAYGRATSNGGTPPLALRLQHAVFERLVYAKVRERLGYSKLIAGLSSAAAIRADLLYFFQGIGVDIVELWGSTEMAGPGTANPRARFKPGTVGRPIPGVAVALDDDGEILVAGPNVFLGYHSLPKDSAECLETIDGERWFRTGDLGTFDDDGYLRIVDRKKEIEVLDTGKKIAPITVEETLKTVSPLVMEACLVGHGRKYAGALVQPNFDRLVAWARERSIQFDESLVVVKPDPTGSPMTYAVGEDLLRHPDVQRLYEAEIAKCNAKCADFERIKVFHLVPHVFTMDRDELTPSLKKKRRVILANYRDAVEEMFQRAQKGG